jgi:uncharacterized BrkB/YihY/UPF0761 family membrane protein
MFNKIKLGGWGVAILVIIHLYVVNLYTEFILSREVSIELQIVSTLGVLVSTYYMFKLIYKFIYNNLKEKKDD